MRSRRTLAGLAAFACLSTAHAQSANTIYVTTGWFHFMPQGSSDPLKVDSVDGYPINTSVPGSGTDIGSSDTAGFSIGYFITDHIAAEAEMGIPPKFDLDGEGSLGQFGKLGSARLWSPALLLKYYFNQPTTKFRPYVGIGVTRVWFTDAQLTNPEFTQGVLQGPTSVSTDRSWAPVLNAGFNYAFTKHWFAGFSLSFIPVDVTATLNTNSPVFSQRSEAKIHLNPLVSYLKVGYAF
ncbi:hypothetical protein CY652_16060 [Burkholderia sp. WAC0059]|uniref:OmpW/AlkL family protein n=1 Tax=Burkholderia sp. WAC0059 TaxID=2066022 RepID=UPI000C7F3BC3|nr:OmpW family outer membrane protein [Burkholderia sp. WAC0059]PLZ01350.1 hypothetical protein CY652_16060 [Burkholderia sp. WAC0059]